MRRSSFKKKNLKEKQRDKTTQKLVAKLFINVNELTVNSFLIKAP
jgi:hypothetical protein